MSNGFVADIAVLDEKIQQLATLSADLEGLGRDMPVSDKSTGETDAVIKEFLALLQTTIGNFQDLVYCSGEYLTQFRNSVADKDKEWEILVTNERLGVCPVELPSGSGGKK